jgi:hypothetical protein
MRKPSTRERMGAVHMIFGGSPARPSRRQEKLIRHGVYSVESSTPSYLKWSEVLITFDHKDHPNRIPQPGAYPLVVAPLFRSKRIHKVLMDGGSGINVLYVLMLDDMGILWSKLCHQPHHSTGSSLGWRHSHSGRSICPSRSGRCKIFTQKPTHSKWWGSQGRTTPSSGGQLTRSSWSCPTICT